MDRNMENFMDIWVLQGLHTSYKDIEAIKEFEERWKRLFRVQEKENGIEKHMEHGMNTRGV